RPHPTAPLPPAPYTPPFRARARAPRPAGRPAGLARREVRRVDRPRGRPTRGRRRRGPPPHQRDALLAHGHGGDLGQHVLRGGPRRRLGRHGRAQPGAHRRGRLQHRRRHPPLRRGGQHDHPLVRLRRRRELRRHGGAGAVRPGRAGLLPHGPLRGRHAVAPTTGRPPVLSRRALNRALLARQLLLERSTMPVLDAVHHLVGLQAQAPWSPYHALWARLEGFDPHELGALLTERRTVRIVLMRSTVHWVTAEDCLFLRPLLAGFLERALLTSPWRRGLQDLDHDAVAEAARRLVEEEPMTFKRLGVALAERWPGRDPATLAQLARARVPLVQLPPRAVWGRTGQVVVTTAEAWLGRPLDPAPDPERMLLRYLAAFGPASVMDAQ